MLTEIIEALLVALCASVSGFVLCALMIGVAWHAAKPTHEADQQIGGELDIPTDREFTDPDSPTQRDPRIAAPVFGRFDSPSFPHDHSYATKRF